MGTSVNLTNSEEEKEGRKEGRRKEGKKGMANLPYSPRLHQKWTRPKGGGE
jgi:hypothetical protein